MTDLANRAGTTPITDTIAAMTPHQQCSELVLEAAPEGVVVVCVHQRPMVRVQVARVGTAGTWIVHRVHPATTPIRWALWKIRGDR